MSEPLPREIRCVLIPSGGVRLLLPNAAVAEVITLAGVEPVADAPAWLLGRIAWRGWSIPLVNFDHVASLADDAPPQASRVAVLKAVGHRPDMPYIAVLTHGFPRLTTLNAELLLPTHDGHELPFGVRARVLVRDDTAVIPDLEQLEDTLSEMLAEA
ncbi:chemosensory pili system protein ChpC [Luteibacter jiangsuensis]|uniref:Chemosensory pili system protein ChpC n=1 Tax=Luteibacter jiangsuensis TaxID=637577 RepID=A0ABT9T3M8_9GAMM|nr:chemotaxis protein CheW [Luteibacter jiangsuensis]MDQ0011271.1 chemosensory pili system protein ChpC [Luteibacter jiangsuensis]